MDTKISRLLKGQGGNYIFPFFWQHGETEEVLREYMRVIAESNIRAVCVESRPHPDFCGPKWWKDMDVILDEAEKRRMKVWILDDSHFPTGFANGAMADKPDELCRQSICYRTYEAEGGMLFRLGEQELLHPEEQPRTPLDEGILKGCRVYEDDRLLGLYAMRQEAVGTDGFAWTESLTEEDKEAEARPGAKWVDLKPLICGNDLEWQVPEGNWKVYALHLSRNMGYRRNYINMMDKESCRVQIEAVYEPHYARYGEKFGKTIAGFFSDEPELGNGHLYQMDECFGTLVDYPWSRELEVRLQEVMGKEYGLLLALLWETEADAAVTARVRYAYMDAVSDLVKKDFSLQLGEWCRAHGVEYIGHLIEDDNHHSKTTCSLGHYFRGLAGQDMAGIDNIRNQVLPQEEDNSYDYGMFQHRNGEFYHYVMGKLGSSAAAIEPGKKGNSMCEIFGAYGWSEGVRLEKYLLDHFLVRGINHFVPHAFSPKEFPDPDCPPHFYAHGHNPQYRHFGALMAYTNRMCELIQGGRRVAPVALLYYAEGEWSGAYQNDDRAAHVMADQQIEYDIIPQEVLAKPQEYRTEFREGCLQVNTQEYRMLIIPYSQFLTEELARGILALGEHGIPVVFTEDYPEGLCNGISGEAEKELIEEIRQRTEVVPVTKLVEVIRRERLEELTLSPADGRIRYLHYVQEDGCEIWMFVNEGEKEYQGEVQLIQEADGTAYVYDAWDNLLEPAGWNPRKRTFWLELEPYKSKVLVFDPKAGKEDLAAWYRTRLWPGQEGLKKTGTEAPFSGSWRRSLCASIDYPAFAEEKEVGLPDRLAEEEPEFSGFVRYENEFMAERGEPLWLEITDASEGVEVFVNGVSLGIQIVPTYCFDLTDALQEGRNQLCIEVATTLERQMAKFPDSLGQVTEATCGSGITGEVHLWRLS